MNLSIFGSSYPKFVYDYGVANQTFTASSATERLTISGHGLYEGQRVKVSSTTTLPAPLEADTIYYVKIVDANNIQLASEIGGSAIDLTDTGTGTHSLITEMTVRLENWTPIKDDIDSRKNVIESELIADREFLDRGEFFEFYGSVYLFKYGLPQQTEVEAPEGDAVVENITAIREKANEIYHYRKKKVALFKHSDGRPYYDIDGNVAEFYIESVVFKNLQTLDYRDVVFIRFLSLKEIDFAYSSQAIYWITETGANVVDESDNKVII